MPTVISSISSSDTQSCAWQTDTTATFKSIARMFIEAQEVSSQKTFAQDNNACGPQRVW